MWLCAVIGLAPASLAQQREEAKQYRLRWVREGGAESCVSGAALERLLDRVVEARAGSTELAPLLEGSARPAPPPLKYELRVVMRDPVSGEVVGERTLTTADERCAVLTEALLLVLAMSIDPEVGRDGLPPSVTESLRDERDAEAEVAPQASPLLAAPPTPRPAPSERKPSPKRERRPSAVEPSRDEPRVFGTLEVAAGVLPRPAAGAALGGSIPLRRGWALSLSVHGFLPQIITLAPSAYLLDEGVHLAAGQLNAALCRPVLGDRLQLAACAGLGAGLRWVDARALGTRLNPAHPYFGPTLGLQAALRVQPSWFLAAGATAQAALGGERFTYRDHLQESLVFYDPPAFSARLWLGVGAYL